MNIKPALTPEEWASFPNWPDEEGRVRIGEAAPEPLYYPSRHGIAAANLHNQPFGFTREDIGLLRGEVLPHFKGVTRWANDKADRIEALADRIEALLPPEEK